MYDGLRQRHLSATKAARKAIEDTYRPFEVAYRIAAERLRADGDPHGFPDGAFPTRRGLVAA